MRRALALALALTLLLLAGCGPARQAETAPPASPQPAGAADPNAPVINGLTYSHTMELQYANGFAVYYYDGGYKAITTSDGAKYLVIPEGGQVPEGAGDFIPLWQPLERIYLVATAAMALFRSIDGVGAIRLSGAKEEAWYIPEAADAMARGDILFAGKYSAPDYELLVGEECDLAIQSTMIYHSPQVREKLMDLGIPVFVERSTYESHPLGRTEWVKVYGAMLNKEAEAEAAFRQQAELVEALADFPNTEKTVAFFYVTNSGTVSVRKGSDYLAKMIELAGGRYVFRDLAPEDSGTATVNMTMEEFYAAAKDADYLIYNATIDETMEEKAQLLLKSDLFLDFKAYQNGDVWCTGKYLYQATDVLGGMISDIHTILTDPEADGALNFIHKLT